MEPALRGVVRLLARSLAPLALVSPFGASLLAAQGPGTVLSEQKISATQGAFVGIMNTPLHSSTDVWHCLLGSARGRIRR